MKFFHVSDVNLGYRPDASMPWSEKRSQDIKDTFQRVLDECESQKIDALFLTGNLFSHIPDENELRELDRQFMNLSVTKIFLLTGENEYFPIRSVYEEFHWESATTIFSGEHLEQVPINEWNCTITGVSYNEDTWEDISWEGVHKGVNQPVQLLLLPKFIQDSGELLYSKGYDYIGYGGMGNSCMSQDNSVCSPGTLEPLCANHTHVHGYISGTIEINEDGAVEKDIKFIEYAVCEYIFIKVNVDEEMTMELLKEQMKRAITSFGIDNIYKMVLSGPASPDLFYSMDELKNTGNVLEIVNRTTSPYLKLDIGAEGDMDIASRFARKLNSMAENEDKQLIMDCGINAIRLSLEEEN